MKIKTSELTGAALDWAVAQCEGVSFVWLGTDYSTDGRTFQRGTAQAAGPHYSTNWAQGGPIIERERIQIAPLPDKGWRGHWRSFDNKNWREVWMDCCDVGVTALIAAMRCYVASKLGDEVDVPEELK